MRLAWFTPWPPQSSGVAGRSAELVPALCQRGLGIDVFVDEREVAVGRLGNDSAPSSGECRVAGAHEFVWRHRRGHYDLAVYQVGNSRLHEFIWPYLFQWPGLAVLHDARLHHARGRARLSRGAFDDYRQELRWSHPDLAPEAAELGVAGFDGSYYYLWSMTRGVVEASRLVASHTRVRRADLLPAGPEQGDLGPPIEHIRLGEGRRDRLTEAERQHVRADLGLTAEHVLFGVFGGLTADKRVGQILGQFRRIAARMPQARLLLCGAIGHDLPLDTALATDDLASRVTVLPPADDQRFDDLIGAVDVSLNLRWPSACETSGPWLRALAAGRPTVTIALSHQAHVPALDPRTWIPWPGQPGQPPVTVALDILDEEHSLGRAMERLAHDADLRASLGEAARQYWERTHTLDLMLDDYVRVLPLAASAPIPAASLPPAMRPDPLTFTRSLLAPFDNEVSCELF